MLSFLTHLAPGALYPGIFVGIIFLGGLILLPAMYLSTTGTVSLGILFLITLLASLCADSFWYVVGALAQKEKLYALPFLRKRIEGAKAFSAYFEKRGVFLVFIAKFVYGARLASHILAGMHRLPFFKFVGAVLSGTAVWFGIFYVLLHMVDIGVSGAKSAATRIELGLLILVLILGGLNWFTGTFIRKKMMQKQKNSSK